MPTPDNGIRVSTREYIDELGRRLERRLDRLDGKVDGFSLSVSQKADNAALLLLDARLTKLERAQSEALGALQARKWMVGLAVSLAGIVGALLGLVLRGVLG